MSLGHGVEPCNVNTDRFNPDDAIFRYSPRSVLTFCGKLPAVVLVVLLGVRVGEPGAEMQHGRSMKLRDPRFYDTKDESDLLHRGFLVVVEGHDQALMLRQLD
jgi:hypothetical protein